MNESLILLVRKNIPFFSYNAKINKMSWVSFISVIVGTIAITCTIAIINGTASLVKQTLTTFDSDIQISNKQSKYFNSADIDTESLRKIPHVKSVNKILKETAYVEYDENFCVVNVLGVEDYNEKLVDKTIGKKKMIGADCIVGLGIYNKLYISLNNGFSFIKIKVPKKKLKTALSGKIYNSGLLSPVGVFSVEQRYDDNFIMANLEYLQKITRNKDLISDIEVSVDDEKYIDPVKITINESLNPDYKVVTKIEKQKLLAKALNIEKILTILSLSVVIIIVLLNLLFILSMIVLHKKKEIMILKFLGETKIFTLFFSIGTLLGFVGSVIGTSISALIIFLQNKFGFIKVGVESMLVNAYPMEIHFHEYLAIVFLFTILSCLLSIYPAKKACKI